MPDVRLKTRIQNKYKTLDEWNSLVKGEFIPLKGEICYAVVDNDTVYQKIGDGITDFTELEWLNNVGVDVVDIFNNLTSQPKEDTISFVENSEFIETINKEISVPFKITQPNTVSQLKIDNNALFLSEIDWHSQYSDLPNNDLGYMIEGSVETPEGELYIQGCSYPKHVMSTLLGVNTAVQFYQLSYETAMWIKLYGLSVKDYLTMIMGMEASEEQMQILFGDHYSDVTGENTNYNWIKIIMTEESIGSNSVDFGGMFVTLEFDTENFLDTLGMINEFAIMISEDPSADESLIEKYYELYDLNESEVEEACSDVSFALSGLLCGGLEALSYDLYHSKGFHHFKDKWINLEEKMNLPKAVETYYDLPKSFINNGISAVLNDVQEPKPPLTEINVYTPHQLKVNINLSTEEIEDSIYQYLNIADEDRESARLEVYIDYMNENEDWGSMALGKRGRDDLLIYFLEPGDYPCDMKAFGYVPDDNSTITLFDEYGTNNPVEYLCETAGWYSWLLYDDGKNCWTKELPVKMTEDFYPFGNQIIQFTDLVHVLSEDEEEMEIFTKFSLPSFSFIPQNHFINYPKGFYRFNEGRWTYESSLNGETFKNSSVLKQLTSEDLGNIILNTEKRHEHNNKYVLDQLPWDSYDKLVNQVPANTNARHTHNNQYYLDQITDSNYVHKHSNKTILDKITSNDNVHTHSNKSILDGITQSKINEISYNTNARHTHSNQTYLDKITYDITTTITTNANARHTHINKSALDAITNSTILDISNNKSARHTHANKTVLDTITQNHLDKIHIHGNKEIIDTINETTISNITANTESRHSHENKNILDKFSELDSKLFFNGNDFINRPILRTVYTDSYTDVYDITLSNGIFFYMNSKQKLNEHFWINLNFENLKDNDVCQLSFCNEKSGKQVHVVDFSEYPILVHTIINFHNIEAIVWTNGIPNLNTTKRFYFYFTKVKNTCFITWYCEDENIQSSQYDYNFGNMINNELVFAPSLLKIENGYTLNNIDEYEIQGYQKIYGDTYSNSSSLNNYEDIEVYYINDIIIINKNYLPSDCCMGDYINSKYINDFSSYFYKYDEEDFKEAICFGLDTNYGTNFNSMFLLSEIITIPKLDLSKGTDFNKMFSWCEDLKSIKKITFDSAKTSIMKDMFYRCYALQDALIEGSIEVDSNDLNLSDTKLTVDSIMSFINSFKDNTNKETQYTVKFGYYNLSKLTEEQISIAINKNILLA